MRINADAGAGIHDDAAHRPISSPVPIRLRGGACHEDRKPGCSLAAASRQPHCSVSAVAAFMPKAALALAAAIAAFSPAMAAEDGDLAYGRALVETNCGPCHAVGLTDESRHAQAPALRSLSERYPLDALEEAFVEGISTGHPDMPEFVATPEQIAAIIDYIASLEPH